MSTPLEPGLDTHLRRMERGAKWFNTVGGLTILVGLIQFSQVAMAVGWVVAFDGGPSHKTWGDVLDAVVKTWPLLLLGWLLLHVRNVFDAMAALIKEQKKPAEFLGPVS